MTKPNSFKRRLLRAAVQENNTIVRESWPRLIQHCRSFRPVVFSRDVVTVVCFALTVLVYAVLNFSENPQAEPDTKVAAAPVTTAEDKPPSPPTPMVVSSVTSLPSSGTPELTKVKTNDAPDPPAAASDTSLSDSLALDPHQVDLNVFALSIKRIVIDPGHGGDDPGTVSHGLTEKALALDIGLRLRTLLAEASFDVRMTRDKDETVSLMRRATLANDAGGDLFVSIHLNWVEPLQTRVVETYYLGPTEDSDLLQLASVENLHSSYSLADFRRLLEGVYTDTKRGESHRLAEAIQQELVRSLRTVNPRLASRAAKTAPFAVLVGANMPAILTEVACLSNAEEAQLLASPDYRQKIAQALLMGIRSYTDALYHTYATRKEASS
ncbi:MAG: N-acetylmuramoyl-L-alanine amidase [Candidatus Binatia bacterium]